MTPDFRYFIIFPSSLCYSAKGSEWKNHKYIKRINGTYYYPDDYEGGRHLPNGEKENNKSENRTKDNILDELENITGMKRESLSDLWDISRKSGYESEEFKELLRELSEGDSHQAQRMIDLLKQGSSKIDLSSNDIENLAREVIRGNFGNGQTRRDLLGENYREIQDRVNEILLGSKGSETKISQVSEEAVKEVEKIVKSSSGGLDMETVYRVYRNKNK